MTYFSELLLLTEENVEKSALVFGKLIYGNFKQSVDFGNMSYVDRVSRIFTYNGNRELRNGIVKGFIDGALDNNDIKTAEYAMRFLD